ncbi:MAG: 3-hydroxyacyl-CoA dehydrogenase family protein [Bryobacteraceae bacterium]
MADWKFESAAVIGTGMMGPGIAMTLALGGVRAAILSRHEESAREGLAKAKSQLQLLASNKLVKSADAKRAGKLLSATADFDAAISSADLVIESAPENMKFKQDLFARMDAIAKPTAVLTSNTSGLSITAIASKCKRPQRVVTTHFWNPPHLMPLVEIVKGKKTDASVAEALKELLARCGKVPVIVKKDTPGQLGNRLQMALVREAIHIVEAGIASVEDVDLAARSGFGLRLPMYGIFEHQDIVGLDMGIGIVDYVSSDLYNKPRAPGLMRKLVKAGHVGAKAGRGFYDWSQKDPAEVRARRDRFVLGVLKQWGAPR